MDAYGGLALFEAADWYYDRIDVSDSLEVPEGYAVRANFSYNGDPNHVGQHRHDRAIELIDAMRGKGLTDLVVEIYEKYQKTIDVFMETGNEKLLDEIEYPYTTPQTVIEIYK